MNKRLIAVAAALMVGAAAVPAVAHHSFATFDMSKTNTYRGVVKTVQWTNPHVWVEIVVKEGNVDKAYNFEGGAVAVLKRAGWTKDSVKVGDTITIVGHPFRTSQAGGSMDRVTLPDGRVVGAGDAIPGALTPTSR